MSTGTSEKSEWVGAVAEGMALDRSRRRWRFWAIALFVFTVLVALPAALKDWPSKQSDHIARISITGLIVEDMERTERLEKLAVNTHVKAVLAYIDSPGGTMVGGLELYDDLLRLSDKKPVVVVMGSMAASAGYLAAIAGTHVVANEATATGSIGVLVPLMDASELAGKIGVKSNFITSGALKDVGSPLKSMQPAERQYLQGIVNRLQDVFLEKVTTRRELSEKALAKVKDGRAIIGVDALELGLIDALGGQYEARKWLETHYGLDMKTPLRDVPLEEKKSFLKYALNEAFLRFELFGVENFSPLTGRTLWAMPF